MDIANPIYDAAFKYLMDDKKAATLIIGTITGYEIEDLELRPTEFSVDGDDGRNFTVYRLDFAAKVKSPTGTRIVLIEIQKAKFYTDIVRFRRYLGTQYASAENIENLDDDLNDDGIGRKRALPIHSIYILGHILEGLRYPVIQVKRALIDVATGQEIPKKNEFIDSLTHDCTVIQVPELKQRRRTRLEVMLSVFDQALVVRKDKHVIAIREEDYPEEFRPIVRRLLRAIAEKEVRQRMTVEDEYLSELEHRDRAIKKERKLKEENEGRRKKNEDRRKRNEDRRKQHCNRLRKSAGNRGRAQTEGRSSGKTPSRGKCASSCREEPGGGTPNSRPVPRGILGHNSIIISGHEKMDIANPIYDAAFKYLMDDKKAATLIIGTITGYEIEDLELRPTEFSVDGDDGRNFTVYRLDFAAKVKSPTGTRIVLIEIQKAKFYTDIVRFRRYLGTQYASAENIENLDDDLNDDGIGRKRALPIHSIYILGHILEGLRYPVIQVKRALIDVATGQEIPRKNEFIDSLTHDCTVIQVPELKQRRRTRLEVMLSVFDQALVVRKDKHVIAIREEDYPEEFRPIVRRLLRAIAEKEVRQRMTVEDEYLSELEHRDRAIKKERKLKEEERRQKEEERRQKEAALQQVEEERRQVEEERRQKEGALGKLHLAVSVLVAAGKSPEEARQILGLSQEEY